jgi:hypothetical protein
MSILRAMFWVGLAVMVLPSDSRKQEELYGKMASAAHWTMTFCDRNGATCAKSVELWQVFRQKAEFGARVVADLVDKGMKGKLEPLAVPGGETPGQAETPEARMEQAAVRKSSATR